MAFPKLLQKLFTNSGAGDKLNTSLIPDTVVQTSAQSFSTTQQAQARSNIGALTADKTEALKSLGFDPSSAGFANSIWGGRNLTSTYTIAQLSTKVQAGDFSDLYVGDYITQSVTVSGTAYSVNWLFADFDYQLGNGDAECTAHHIVMMPSACLGTAQMNSSNVIDGGYIGSAMWKTTIPAVATGIKNAFGTSHCLSFRTLLSNTVNTSAASMAGAGRTGCSTDWAWYDCICNLPSEPQVYGTMVHSSSFYDVGERKTQFSLFRHNTHAMNIRANWWLSAVGLSDGFCRVTNDGFAYAYGSSNSFGVRPYFLFH